MSDEKPPKADVEAAARILLEYQNLTEEEKDKLFMPLGLPLIRWVDAPEGAKCLGCGKETLERSVPLMGGKWSGSVRCKECDYRDSLMTYLGKTIITVEPLPEDKP